MKDTPGLKSWLTLDRHARKYLSTRGRARGRALGNRLAPALTARLAGASRENIRRFTTTISWLWMLLVPRSRRLGMDNLDLVFGNSLSYRQKWRICRRSIASILFCSYDLYRVSFLPPEKRPQVYMDHATRERCTRIMEEYRDKGLLVLTGHLGNWELLLSVLGEYGPISLIARDQGEFDHYVTGTRSRLGVGTLHDNEVSSAIIAEHLQSGRKAGFIYDRNLSHSRGVVMDFLGAPAYAPTFAVNLALRQHLPVLPAFLIPEGDHYRLYVEEPIVVQEQADRQATYERAVGQFLDVMGDYIRRHPEHWFWCHKRWHRPKGDVLFDFTTGNDDSGRTDS